MPQFEYTTNPHLISPVAPWPTTPVGAGTWVYSPWVQLLASTPGTGIAVTGAIVYCKINNSDLVPFNYEVEIGVGASGSEIGIGWVYGHTINVGFNYGGNRTFRPLCIPYQLDGGVRVSARFRKSRFDASPPSDDWGLALGYYALPIVGNVSTTLQKQRAIPQGDYGIGIDTTGLVAGAWSAWSTMSAGLNADITVAGIEYKGQGTQLNEFEIGYGSVPVSLTRIRERITGGTAHRGGPCNVDFFPTVGRIVAHTPILCRMRLETAISTTCYVKLIYMELPLEIPV